jgi:spermidine synthase
MNMFSLTKQWRGQEVLSYRNSVYGNLAVIKSKGQYTFYNDGIPIITTPSPDIASIEELAHFTLLSHPQPKRILLLSGAAGGLIKEILKYPVEKLTYTELDPLLIKLIRDFPTELTKSELSDPRLEIKYIDGRRFLHLTKEKYDVIILNLPMPSTLQLNRYYTQEFFQNIKSALNKEGIFSFDLPGSLSYLSPAMVNLNATILNTLESVFYVNIIPGDVNLYLAQKEEFKITPQLFLERLEQNHIQTKLLNQYFLEYRLSPDWLKWFQDSLSGYSKARKNLDLLPKATFYSITYWNDIFSPRLQGFFKTLDKLNFKLLALILLFFGLTLLVLNICIPGFKKSSIGFAICTTGFIGMSFDLILIYAYQSFFGFVYSHLALLVTAFMAGLTLGGWQMNRNLDKIKSEGVIFSKIELAMVGFCLSVGLLLVSLKGFLSLAIAPLFFLLSALCGYLVGLEFPLANKIYGHDKSSAKTAGILYAVDLFGAWVAALLISILLVPVIGIIQTCLLLAGLKIISLIWILLSL